MPSFEVLMALFNVEWQVLTTMASITDATIVQLLLTLVLQYCGDNSSFFRFVLRKQLKNKL